MEKFRNKYRNETTRAKFWDYSWNAAYFVTICTKHRYQWFGNIQDGADKVDLSVIGHIANSCWIEIPKHFPFVELGSHIVMPNHVHGIVIIRKKEGQQGNYIENVGTQNVGTQNFASLHINVLDDEDLKIDKSKPRNKFGPQSQNLASIIRGYKVGVTKNARKIFPDFEWQSRYHDHIIRDNKSYEKISEYINSNPANWDSDKFHSTDSMF